jgi:triacylglycerol esterase/lipase EstA (alpha/beta hydrolase family)
MTGDEVVLVHGFMDDTDGRRWDRLEEALMDDGYDEGDIHRVSFSSERDYAGFAEGMPGTTTDHPEYYARELQAYVEEELDGDDASILAHSMGGLASRYYLEELGGDEYVDSLVTLGTPHQGSVLATFGWFTRGGRAMTPGSDFLEELNEDYCEDVEYTVVWSKDDRTIRPAENARMPFEDENIHDIEIKFHSGLLDAFRPFGYNHLKLMGPDVYEEYREYL